MRFESVSICASTSSVCVCVAQLGELGLQAVDRARGRVDAGLEILDRDVRADDRAERAELLDRLLDAAARHLEHEVGLAVLALGVDVDGVRVAAHRGDDPQRLVRRRRDRRRRPSGAARAWPSSAGRSCALGGGTAAELEARSRCAALAGRPARRSAGGAEAVAPPRLARIGVGDRPRLMSASSSSPALPASFACPPSRVPSTPATAASPADGDRDDERAAPGEAPPRRGRVRGKLTDALAQLGGCDGRLLAELGDQVKLRH